MNYEGYAAGATGAIAGIIGLFSGIICNDVIGGMFAGACLFVIGVGAFVRVTDAVKRYKAIQAWERHHSKPVDFRIGRVVPGAPDYVEFREVDL